MAPGLGTRLSQCLSCSLRRGNALGTHPVKLHGGEYSKKYVIHKNKVITVESLCYVVDTLEMPWNPSIADTLGTW